MKRYAALVLLLLTSSQALAISQRNSPCADKLDLLDNTRVQTLQGKQGCMISVSARAPYDMTYRSFLLQGNGVFMIFNSMGNGPSDSSTGAREYYFFPRNQEMGYSYDARNKRVSVRAPSGKVFVFNTEKTILVSISGTQFTMDYDVNPNNGGGVEITKNNTVYLDVGFELGQSPSQRPRKKIAFKDAQNNSCFLTNAEVFNYTADFDVVMKYSDAQLPKFLAKRCPNLKF